MKLTTKAIMQKAQAQYPMGSDMNQLVVAKFFDPYGAWTWYLMNVDPEDGDYCWGIVDGHEVEAGSWLLSEMQDLKTPWGRPRIERDLYFRPQRAIEIWNRLTQ
jgi:hypothetical protein